VSDILQEIVIPFSRKKMLLAGFVSILMWAACFVLLMNQDTSWYRPSMLIPASFVVLLPLGIFFCIKTVFDPRPRIKVSREGLFDRTLRIGTVEWPDLLEIVPWAQSINAHGRTVEVSYFALKLRDSSKYIQRLSRIDRQLLKLAKLKAPEPFNICLLGITYDRDELLDQIKKRIDAHSKV
jgi:hypothetical protein